MNQSYSHILTFWFKHRYFGDELFKSVDISFAEGSQKIMNNLGLIIKPFAGGFYVLTSNPELLDSLDDINPLQIYLYSKDPLYINYTELPSYNLRDKLIWFSNLTKKADPENGSFLLHYAGYASGDDIIQISHGEINIPDFNPEKNYRFTDTSGNEIYSEYVTQSANDSGSFLISGITQGLVRIFSDNEEILKVYYYPNTIWKKPMGIVELFTGELFKQYNAIGKVEYSICFDNRKTTWKYFLVSEVYQKFRNLSIINKSKEQIFLPPQKQTLQSSSIALVFESKIKIPLSELSDENFQLVDNFDLENRSGTVILKSLAKASSEQLFSDASKTDGNVYSHIYI